MTRPTITLVCAVLLAGGLAVGVATAHGGGHGGAANGSSAGADGGDALDVALEEPCPHEEESWRAAQTVAGVAMQSDPQCRPDSPAVVAASVAGTNNVPGAVLMRSGLARDAVVKRDDRDGDGDPDRIQITLEIAGLNEHDERTATDAIAPGVAPAFWTFVPKTRGMIENGTPAQRLHRLPAPPIRVEQGDDVAITVENTHYLPHTLHLHGVDHPFSVDDEGNDGVPHVSERPIPPGENRTYEFTPRQAGSMFYHCHVVPNVHVEMGLNGLFVVETNRSDNRVQTFNPGGGKVRHPAEGVDGSYDGEFDLHYQAFDRELHRIPQELDDPREVAEATNRVFDVTDASWDDYVVNGRSFPYSLRSSQVVVRPDRRYRLRVLNAGPEQLALHSHGHKVTVEARDGVPVPEGREPQRDVVDLAAAQRLDLALNTTDDGRNSYGSGVWFMHDHREPAVTTDGVGPGGDITTITYRSMLGDDGLPATAEPLDRFFSAAYYEGEVPFWAELDATHLATRNVTYSRTNGDAGSGTSSVEDGEGTVGEMAGGMNGGMDGGTDGATSGGTSDGMAMDGGGMRMAMVPNGTVVNANPDRAPPGCDGIEGNTSLTVDGGHDHAEPGEMFAFAEDTYRFDTCTRVTVTFANTDDVRHQWMVHGLPHETYPMGMFNLESSSGGAVTGTFVTPAEPQRLSVHCSLPQHEQKGMAATVLVGDVGDGAPDHGSADAASTDDAGVPDGSPADGFTAVVALVALVALAIAGRRRSV